ncbi:MAG: hypothetical protein U0236_07865 [Nitrospira sp.]
MRQTHEAEAGRSHGDQFFIEGQPAKGGHRGDEPGNGKREDESEEAAWQSL